MGQLVGGGGGGAVGIKWGPFVGGGGGGWSFSSASYQLETGIIRNFYGNFHWPDPSCCPAGFPCRVSKVPQLVNTCHECLIRVTNSFYRAYRRRYAISGCAICAGRGNHYAPT